jgi:hypothetical protein
MQEHWLAPTALQLTSTSSKTAEYVFDTRYARHKNPTFNVRNEIHFIRNSVVLTFLKVTYTMSPDGDLIYAETCCNLPLHNLKYIVTKALWIQPNVKYFEV